MRATLRNRKKRKIGQTPPSSPQISTSTNCFQAKLPPPWPRQKGQFACGPTVSANQHDPPTASAGQRRTCRAADGDARVCSPMLSKAKAALPIPLAGTRSTPVFATVLSCASASTRAIEQRKLSKFPGLEPLRRHNRYFNAWKIPTSPITLQQQQRPFGSRGWAGRSLTANFDEAVAGLGLGGFSIRWRCRPLRLPARRWRFNFAKDDLNEAKEIAKPD